MMGKYGLAAAAVLMGVSALPAQFGVPGTPVGTPLGVKTVGTDPGSAVGSPVGSQVGSAPGGIMPSLSPDFSKIDPKMLSAPLPVYPGIGSKPTLWNRLTEPIIRVFSYINPFQEAPVARPPWVPGISRRNRERAEQRALRLD